MLGRGRGEEAWRLSISILIHQKLDEIFCWGFAYGHGHRVRRWEEEDSRFRQGTRVPLNPWQQAAVAVGAAGGAALNPARADPVAAVCETTAGLALQRILERMKRSPEGQVWTLPTFFLETNLLEF
ncbi:hypothetical protein R1flu_028945 [Riccia fluitans]|uniref:Uncharacterized protein n=1 Tax=Riccia fluitans TaxID=41844 RepID=A0ABD1XN40_9MARC